ncbi:RagB/SusD family nutrient uptake outer membrane protein [Pedobacter sp. MC2016-14]|uniref:RagB/SusD family nutrient uptake outer membrane protein n=1 Tax=Pedobacter sp. MC2016-14 TaxID=2897327 RepID=UPI001E28B871|nr:RagB/SusD family nutrient uptake outer membrane protein [Pedobacter sp. MC2016-14]MCD0489859.1 RagB/SusD family nutrient uptake outer membrane protein [Pedobacter sp. MC2016-14]
MKIFHTITICILVAAAFTGCRKFVELDPPNDRLNYSTVYATNATATAVLNGLYTRISETNNVITSYATSYLAFSADELKSYNTSATSNYTQLYQNKANSNTEFYWSTTYTLIYNCNAAIEGMEGSNTLNQALKQQLIGEAKFMRALCYHYLVNTYGKVPLVISPDYRLYTNAKRAEVSEVYAQMIADLQDAQVKLSREYLNGDALTPYSASNAERVRPTYWAATALLARVYLYNEKWAEAESASSIVIGNTGLFMPVAPASVFLKNTKEAIFQLQPVAANNYAIFDARTFVLTTSIGTTTNPASLSPDLEAAFEANDLRRANWVGSATISGVTYLFPYKYKANTASLAAARPEYLNLLRIGEQYLIRAEARAYQNKLDGAKSDIDVIRGRAGLGGTPANTQVDLLDAVMKERRVELFCEQGHRWMDLKRTRRIDDVMKIATPKKGGTWESYKQLLPVPAFEIGVDKALDQNFGYPN